VGEKRNVYKIVVGKPARKGSLGRIGCKWENIIKTDLEKVPGVI
jgi:hypothetical protein